MTMCHACVEYAATWGPHVGLYAREPVCEDTHDAETVRTPTRAYLNERTPGTSVHEVMEVIREALEVPEGQMTNAEMDRMEEAAASQERLQRRLEEHHAGVRRFSMVPLDPRQTHVVIAHSRAAFVRYCDDHGLRTRGTIHVRPDDRMGDRLLMGLANIAIHRVDGAMAEDRVESYLRHLVSTGRARGEEVARDASRRPEDIPYHYVVDEVGRFLDRAEAFSRFYGSGRNREVHRTDSEREPGDNYRPHGAIHTRPTTEDAMHEPHHWASTLERSPYWYHATKTLHTDAGVYRADELDLDIRYV